MLGRVLCRIGGRLRSGGASHHGANVEIPPWIRLSSNSDSRETGQRTVSVGQFDWGGLLQKSNGGVQRYPQPGWQSGIERKGRRVLDCETHKSSRYESRT